MCRLLNKNRISKISADTFKFLNLLTYLCATYYYLFWQMRTPSFVCTSYTTRCLDFLKPRVHMNVNSSLLPDITSQWWSHTNRMYYCNVHCKHTSRRTLLFLQVCFSLSLCKDTCALWLTASIVIWDGALWFWSVIKTTMTDWQQCIFLCCRDLANNRVDSIAPGAFQQLPSLRILWEKASWPLSK